MAEVLGFALFAIAFLAREYTAHKEKQDLMAERSELLNRIKPETAVISNLELPELVDHVQTDEDYWKAHENSIKEKGSYPYGYEEEARGR